MKEEEAMSVLGLNNSLNLKELKSVYRSKAYMVHPDRFNKLAIELNSQHIIEVATIKFQAVQEAYDVLKKLLEKNKIEIDKNYTFNIISLKKCEIYEIINDLIDVDELFFKGYKKENFKEYLTKQLDNNKIACGYIKSMVDFSESLQDVEGILQQAKQIKDECFLNIKTSFSADNNISIDYINANLEKQKTLGELYCDLLKIKQKHIYEETIKHLNQYKLQKVSKIKDTIKNIKMIGYPDYLNEKINNFLNELNSFCLEINKTNDIDKIDEIFIVYGYSYIAFCKCIKETFYENNDIDKEFLENEVNYELEFQEFYKILEEKILVSFLKNKIDIEIEKYSSYKGFDKITNFVNITIENAKKQVESKNHNLNSILKTIRYNIEGYLKLYFEALDTINEMKKWLKENNEQVKNNIFYRNFEFKIEKLLLYLEKNEFNNYFSNELMLLCKEFSKLKVICNNEEFLKSFEELMNRYGKIYLSYQLTTDLKRTQLLNQLLTKIMNLVNNFLSKDLDLNNLLDIFTKIEFLNIKNDEEILLDFECSYLLVK